MYPDDENIMMKYQIGTQWPSANTDRTHNERLDQINRVNIEIMSTIDIVCRN